MCGSTQNWVGPHRVNPGFLGRPKGGHIWGDPGPQATQPGSWADPLDHFMGRPQGDPWADPGRPALDRRPTRRRPAAGHPGWADPPWVDPSGLTHAPGLPDLEPFRQLLPGGGFPIQRGVTTWASPPATNILGQPTWLNLGQPSWVDPSLDLPILGRPSRSLVDTWSTQGRFEQGDPRPTTLSHLPKFGVTPGGSPGSTRFGVCATV